MSENSKLGLFILAFVIFALMIASRQLPDDISNTKEQEAAETAEIINHDCKVARWNIGWAIIDYGRILEKQFFGDVAEHGNVSDYYFWSAVRKNADDLVLVASQLPNEQEFLLSAEVHINRCLKFYGVE